MKPLLVFCLLLAAATSTSLAKTKYNLESRVDEASTTCSKYLVANAKDPSSIKLDDQYTYNVGKVFTKDWIWITFNGWGRNTYGAVLRHSYTCEERCKKDEPCTVLEVTE